MRKTSTSTSSPSDTSIWGNRCRMDSASINFRNGMTSADIRAGIISHVCMSAIKLLRFS